MLVGYVGRQGKRVTQAQASGIIRGLSGQLPGLLKEWMIRVINGLGGLEPLLDLLGLSIRKKVRVHVAILPDASKSLGMTATPSSADGPLDAMQNIFWNEANVTLAKGRDRVRVLKDVAPDAALRVHCDAGTIANDLGEAAEYFRSHARRGWRGALGYGDPGNDLHRQRGRWQRHRRLSAGDGHELRNVRSRYAEQGQPDDGTRGRARVRAQARE